MIKKLFLYPLSLLLFFLVAETVFADSQKNVLILHSYHQGYGWTDDINYGLIKKLKERYPNSRLFIEYMDTKRLFNDEYLYNLQFLYANKYLGKQLDLIISSDDNALNFLLSKRDNLFPGVPIVFCGINYFKAERIAGLTGITGVNEEADFTKGLEIALKLHPKTENIVFINDKTTTGSIVKKEIESYLPNLSDYNVEILDDYSIDELIEKVRNYDPGKTLFYYTIYFMDKNGKSFEVGDVLALVKKNTSAPIYGTWSFSFGHGIVGGYLTSGIQQGEKAGELAGMVLRGVSADQIPVIMETPKEYIFDWEELNNYQADLSLLPAESIIVNKPKSFIEENKTIVYSLLIVISFLILIILLLIVLALNRKQKIVLLNDYKSKLEKEVGQKTQSLKNLNSELEKEIVERKKAQNDIVKKNKELEEAMEDFYTFRLGMQGDTENADIISENKKIKEKINNLKEENKSFLEAS